MLIREATLNDAAAIARVRVKTWQTTYRGKLPDSYLDGMDVDTYTSSWESILRTPDTQGYTYVVEDYDGGLVGFSIGGRNRSTNSLYQGELYAIYLLPEHQRKGLGKQLVRKVAARLLADGMTSMLVWVLANNPARRFYQKLGGRYIVEKDTFLGGMTIKELAYGWDDIRPLASLE